MFARIGGVGVTLNAETKVQAGQWVQAVAVVEQRWLEAEAREWGAAVKARALVG